MSEQPRQPNAETVAYYEQMFAEMIGAYEQQGDPAALVFDNYVRWKGLPADGLRLDDPPEPLSRRFTILEYPAQHRYAAYCTVGASNGVIPHSERSFGDERGVRYEYILHALPTYSAEAADLLTLIASYPFGQGVEIGPGFVLPNGEPVVEGSHMEYFYFTYPYLDDQNIYNEQPWGQIERDNVLIQLLWVFPIYKSEADFIRANGPEAFEERCFEKHAHHYDADDFLREPYV